MRKKAVALKYDPTQDKEHSRSPTVIAKGAGLIADEILRRARDSGVHIHQDVDLVELLSKIDLGAEIPEELYEAVARVLALVYKLNKDFDGT